jgi:hypothetical protein
MERYCIFDLASLRFALDPEGASVTVRAPGGEVLGLAAVGDERDQRNVAFAACDAALAQGTVLREDDDGLPVAHKIAFYNPLTGQIAVDAVPHTRVFAGTDLLVLPAEGLEVVLVDGELRGGSVTLSERPVSAATASRAAAMHPAPRF